MNANQIGGIVQNNGVPNALQNSYADSSKAGQMFNNVAYYGISSPTYGTFTMGRQSALSSDLVINYDPISNAGAWSIIAYEGAAGGGGDTENRIYDNSYEYRLNVGPIRLAAEAQLRNGGNSPTGNAFQSGVGFDYGGLSMDFVAGKIYDAMLVPGPLSTAQMGALANNQAGVAGFGGPGYAISCSLGCLSSVISDNTVFQVAAKYTIGPWKLYAGYDHTTYANPDNPLNAGAFAFGGYNVAFANNDFYASNKNLNIFWVGAKYAVTSTLDVTAAYYGERAGYFTVGASPSTAAGTTFASSPGQAASTSAAQAAACAANSAASSGCAGGLDMISVVLDWRFARHMDLYAGVSWLQKFGGFVSGYQLSTNNSTLAGNNVNSRASTFDPGIGLRYQF
jgi:predicted porin